MWQRVEGRVVRNGDAWSTVDFNPGPEDYRSIAELVKEGRISVVHDNMKARVFDVCLEDGERVMEFVKTGKFHSERAPRFAVDSVADYLVAVGSHLGDVYTLAEAADLLFPMYYRMGEAKRNPEPYKILDFTEVETDPNFAEWDWYNYSSHARDIASTLTHRAYKEGWVENIGPGKWKVAI